MLTIARQSFALTLYTLWHLQQWERVRMFEEQAMHHHLASLTAFATHEPKKLGELHERFLRENEQRPVIEVVDARARVRDLVEQHSRMKPAEGP